MHLECMAQSYKETRVELTHGMNSADGLTHQEVHGGTVKGNGQTTHALTHKRGMREAEGSREREPIGNS